MALKYARKGKVTVGTYKVAEIGIYRVGPMTNDMVETTEFGDEFDHFDFGMGRFGQVEFSGHYDPTDTNGQKILESAWKNKSLLTNLRFHIDSTSYWTVDLTNDSSAGILIEQYGAIEFDKAGIGTVSFVGKISGQMVLA